MSVNKYILSGIFKSATNTPLWGVYYVYSNGPQIVYFNTDGSRYDGDYATITEGYTGSDLYFGNIFIASSVFEDASGDTINGILSINGGIVSTQYKTIDGLIYSGAVSLKSFGGGGVSDGNKGDITVSGGGTIWEMNDTAFGKINRQIFLLP